ncbi:hypothetical protein T440DRAFT_520969 [Plenodomus tracheiphilus IPT5]|uniref:Uncharacterized protein n=1 Tax=Plenodomus tracheiphilus IPT5 TaxID=1408161 RepID=A0A6A7AZ90_9PLEO|nr:hypothetical protein T440DRAFT_520969 [Plenodomus tracheiphilus IPT5]
MSALDPLREEEEGLAAVDGSFGLLKPSVSNVSNISGADSAVAGVGIDHGTALGVRPGTEAERGFGAGTGAGAGNDELEHVYLDLDEHDGSTLIAGSDSGVMQGIKQVDVEITDDEAEDSDGEAEDKDPDFGCGVKRKRTIRLIIRSRAFL